MNNNEEYNNMKQTMMQQFLYENQDATIADAQIEIETQLRDFICDERVLCNG